MKVRGTAGSDIQLTWTRRTRIDGDSWNHLEVPLGEEVEAYVVRVVVGSSILAEYQETTRSFSYSAAQQLADGAVVPFGFSVAQVSSTFGPGPFRQIQVPG